MKIPWSYIAVTQNADMKIESARPRLQTARRPLRPGRPDSRPEGAGKKGQERHRLADATKLSAESSKPDTKSSRVDDIMARLADSFADQGLQPNSSEQGPSASEKKTRPGEDSKNAEPDLSPKNIEFVREQANAANDPTALNEIDSFRSQLPPDQQKIYDEQLEALRKDERIRFITHDGAEADLSTRDLVLRGILTSTFGSPEDLEKALNTAAHNDHDRDGDLVRNDDGSGHLEIHLYDGELPLDPLKDPDGTQFAAAVVVSGGDIHANTGFLTDTIAAGENLFTHEFSHVVQGSHSSGKWEGGPFPQDFPRDFQRRFEEEFNSDTFQKYFEGIGLNKDFGNESYPGVQTVFRYFPADFQKASPELYDLMVQYSGYDPLKGESVERQTRQPFDPVDGARRLFDWLNPFN